MKTPVTRPAEQTDYLHDDEIALEPTRVADSETASGAAGSSSGPTQTTMATSFVSDTELLLRQRLLIVALIWAALTGVRYLFALFDPFTGEGLASGSLLARTLFSLAIAALLAERRPLQLRELRLIEYLYFGLLTISILVSQYLVSSELIMRGDAISLVSFDKNGVIRILILMLLYGTMIPNDAKRATRVILSMALCPVLVLACLRVAYFGSATVFVDQKQISQIAISNGLFSVLGAGVAISAAYVMNALRKDLHKAKRLGQYELNEKIGEGGMGAVYLAEHRLLKRPCALKLINPELQSNPVTRARFEREVQSAATLSHPNTIEIFDYGHTDDGTFYYVMEYLPGLSLADLVGKFGPLPAGRAVYIMRQVCKSLAEAHRLGMVHRDLKPANVFIAILGGECDVAKVLDFGLVKTTTSPESPQLTADFTVSGTPSFMAPEQAQGMRDIDGRADIYALGAILYFLLTGKPPFEKETPVALMIAQASEQVRPMSELGFEVPADLEAIVLKCLAKSPADRFDDARDLATALGSCQCASEWNDSRAEEWWMEQADRQNSVAMAASASV
jgi:tRNA A-37 threonylcarbamoyl transferase component Bud32